MVCKYASQDWSLSVALKYQNHYFISYLLSGYVMHLSGQMYE